MDIFEKIKNGLISKRDAKNFLKRENTKYGFDFVKISAPRHNDQNFIAAYRSKDFLAQIFLEQHAIRISVNRTELNFHGTGWEDGITWDELQFIKRGCGFGKSTAVEIYPPDTEIINVANIRHIFIVKHAPDFMWKKNSK